MKKIYKKPEIMFEDFTLSTNIAAGCEVKVGNPSEGICGITTSDPNTTFFNTGIANCTYQPSDGLYDGACYHAPYDTKNLFNS